MKAFFTVDKSIVNVDFSWYGAERYFVDNTLVYKKWNFSFQGKRCFQVGIHEIEISMCITPKEYYCKVYKDGQLYIDELFPELKKKIENKNKGASGWKSFFKNMAIWFVISIVGILLFKYLKLL